MTKDSGVGDSRIASIDMLRGLAIIGVALVHSVLYLSPEPVGFDFTYFLVSWAFGATGAALFATMVGASFIFSTHKLDAVPLRLIIGGAAVRGLFLVIVSAIISLITVGPDYALQGDILQFIGVASFLIAFLYRLPSKVLVLIAIGIWAAAPLLRSALGFVDHWGGGMSITAVVAPEGLAVDPVGLFAPGLDLLAWLEGMLAIGWFPLFPWLAFPVLGLVAGRALLAHPPKLSRNWVLLGLGLLALGLGTALFAASQGGQDAVTGYLSPLSFTPDSTTMVVLQAGLVFIYLGLAHAGLDHGRHHGRWLAVLTVYGRHALTFYVGSWLVIYAPLLVIDGSDAGLMGTYAALIFGLAYTVAAYPVLRIWERHGSVGSLEWAMARLQRLVGRPSTRS